MDHLARQILKDVSLDEIEPKAKQSSPRNPLDHWSSAILLERAAYLKKMARFGDGSASETLREYPQHSVVLLFQSRDGDAEAHQNIACFYSVLAGTATLVTRGTLTRARTVEPGETRGDAIDGGIRQELKAGDFAHVPAGLPHQMLVAGEKSVTCLVTKIEEAL